MDPLHKLLVERARLGGVQLLRDSDLCLVAVRMSFGGSDVYVIGQPDDDSLATTTTPPICDSDTHWHCASTLAPWSKAMGKRIEQFWWMQSDRGSWAALQIDFAVEAEFGVEAKDERPVCIQFVALACELCIREVAVVERAP